MAEHNVPWPVWAVVMLGAAVVSSPVLTRYLAHEEAEKNGSPEVGAGPVKVEVTVKQLGAGSPTAGHGPSNMAGPSLDFTLLTRVGGIARQRHLTDVDLAGLDAGQLDLLRNQIYAHYGRRFHRKALQQYFDAQPWYRPLYAPDSFNEGLMSDVERWNAEFIAKYERQNF
jgi:hypothetical protein